MQSPHLVITTISGDQNKILRYYARHCRKEKVNLIIVGDKKSPKDFELPGCDYWSIKKQLRSNFEIAKTLPFNSYSRKNIGYLAAIRKGANVIIETDDDNLPYKNFWNKRSTYKSAVNLKGKGWVNVYRYFTNKLIWPRGFSLEDIISKTPNITNKKKTKAHFPVQQGLADMNPDIDAIFRLTSELPISFAKKKQIGLGKGSICPFNSQNTTWFKEVFPLLYLPSFCSFRMTDIWRSFVAQRILWEYGYGVLFHSSTVYQERNYHNLIKDFEDEIPGYLNNSMIMNELAALKLSASKKDIFKNLEKCYKRLIEIKMIDIDEIKILRSWGNDLTS